MLSRFDICMARLETGSRQAFHPVTNDRRPERQPAAIKADAEPVDPAQPLAKKNHAKHSDKNDA